MPIVMDLGRTDVHSKPYWERTELAYQAGNSRRGHWFTTHTVAVNMALTKERLINSGFYDSATAYQSVHINY